MANIWRTSRARSFIATFALFALLMSIYLVVSAQPSFAAPVSTESAACVPGFGVTCKTPVVGAQPPHQPKQPEVVDPPTNPPPPTEPSTNPATEVTLDNCRTYLKCTKTVNAIIDNRIPRAKGITASTYNLSKSKCSKSTSSGKEVGSTVKIYMAITQDGSFKVTGTDIVKCHSVTSKLYDVQCYSYFDDKAFVKTDHKGSTTTKKGKKEVLAWGKAGSKGTWKQCQDSMKASAKFEMLPDEFAKYKISMGTYGNKAKVRIYDQDPLNKTYQTPKMESIGKVSRLAHATSYYYLGCKTKGKLVFLKKSQYDSFSLKRLRGDYCSEGTPFCSVPDSVVVNEEEFTKPSKKTITAFRDAEVNRVTFEAPTLNMTSSFVGVEKQDTRLLRSGSPWNSALSAKRNYLEVANAEDIPVKKTSKNGDLLFEGIAVDYEVSALMASDDKNPTTLQNVYDLDVVHTMPVQKVVGFDPKTITAILEISEEEVQSHHSCASPKVNINFVRGVNSY